MTKKVQFLNMYEIFTDGRAATSNQSINYKHRLGVLLSIVLFASSLFCCVINISVFKKYVRTPFRSCISVFDVFYLLSTFVAIIAIYLCILKLGCTAIKTFSNQTMAINRSYFSRAAGYKLHKYVIHGCVLRIK